MKTQIITIGDEILTGQTLDTNSAFIANHLNQIGIEIIESKTISDKENHIIKSLDSAFKNSDLIILTGGLGPTADDITKKVLTSYFDDQLEINKEVLRDIENYFSERGIEFLEVNREQAMLPSKAKIIRNDLGTASGMWFKKGNQHLISLPGVPYEMEALLLKVLPELKEIFNLADFYHRTVLFQGIVETQLSLSIKEVIKECDENNISIAYLPSLGIVKLRFTSTNKNIHKINSIVESLKVSHSKWIFGENNDLLEKIIGLYLQENHLTIGTVESCTGGGIAKRITSIAGSSAYFIGSIVPYDNRIKSDVVGIPTELINKHGAVSKEVVEAMAINGRKKLNVDYCISTSGIAGPDGGSKEKHVGTVWIAISSENKTYSKQFTFGQNRERNVELTIVFALNYLRRVLLNFE